MSSWGPSMDIKAAGMGWAGHGHFYQEGPGKAFHLRDTLRGPRGEEADSTRRTRTLFGVKFGAFGAECLDSQGTDKAAHEG